MKRYDIVLGRWRDSFELEESKHGEVVKWEDVEKSVSIAAEEVARQVSRSAETLRYVQGAQTCVNVVEHTNAYSQWISNVVKESFNQLTLNQD